MNADKTDRLKRGKREKQKAKRETEPLKWPFQSSDSVKWFLTAAIPTDAFESTTKCQSGLRPGGL